MQLETIEKQVYDDILKELVEKPDCRACDKMFGKYSDYLSLCASRGLESRAARFSREQLVPAVLELERKLATQFHKGALFHDTGLAHFIAGNEDGYEYFLAMTDEEEVRKNPNHKRGTANLLSGRLAVPVIASRMEFACNLLNGKITGNPVNFVFVTSSATIVATQFDVWRQTLDNLHQFELLRIIHDIEVFLGSSYPNCPASSDNPFVLLRLAKSLSHLSQWVESCLTQWQNAKAGTTLSEKLKNDPDFGKPLSAAAGGDKQFAGSPPHGAAVDGELLQLLADLKIAPIGNERHWRLLRILYIVRNSTAHTIDPKLAMYNDRSFLLNLLQVIFVSIFTICQLKTRPMP